MRHDCEDARLVESRNAKRWPDKPRCDPKKFTRSDFALIDRRIYVFTQGILKLKVKLFFECNRKISRELKHIIHLFKLQKFLLYFLLPLYGNEPTGICRNFFYKYIVRYIVIFWNFTEYWNVVPVKFEIWK